MVEIKEKLPGVELKRTEVQADAAVAEAEAAECLAGKQSVEADLSVAMPALDAAIKVPEGRHVVSSDFDSGGGCPRPCTVDGAFLKQRGYVGGLNAVRRQPTVVSVVSPALNATSGEGYRATYVEYRRSSYFLLRIHRRFMFLQLSVSGGLFFLSSPILQTPQPDPRPTKKHANQTTDLI